VGGGGTAASQPTRHPHAHMDTDGGEGEGEGRGRGEGEGECVLPRVWYLTKRQEQGEADGSGACHWSAGAKLASIPGRVSWRLLPSPAAAVAAPEQRQQS
jgi:hypothetical protein